MYNEEILLKSLIYLSEIDGFQDFYKQYTENTEIETSEDLFNFFKSFKKHLINKEEWDEDLELLLKITIEKINAVKHQKSDPLFSINQSIQLNDSWINEFHEDFKQCLTGDKYREELKPKRYKTISEYVILESVDGEKLSKVYSKYAEFNHPYVNYTVGSVLYNAKNFSQGLPILKKGIESIASYPNHYWNNKFGIEGATWLIRDLLYLLGNTLNDIKMRDEKIKLLKLLFLYMTRYICMTQSNVKSIDFYSNRARIVKNNYCEFIQIFGLGVNPDIQFISDMYLAYHVAMKYNLTGVPSIRQFMWESKKMYDHGSHIPNNSGGYKEIEGRTWMELVHVGEVRSLNLAISLWKEFKNHELNLSNFKIDKIFEHLAGIKDDKFDSYTESLRKNKLDL